MVAFEGLGRSRIRLHKVIGEDVPPTLSFHVHNLDVRIAALILGNIPAHPVQGLRIASRCRLNHLAINNEIHGGTLSVPRWQHITHHEVVHGDVAPIGRHIVNDPDLNLLPLVLAHVEVLPVEVPVARPRQRIHNLAAHENLNSKLAVIGASATTNEHADVIASHLKFGRSHGAGIGVRLTSTAVRIGATVVSIDPLGANHVLATGRGGIHAANEIAGHLPPKVLETNLVTFRLKPVPQQRSRGRLIAKLAVLIRLVSATNLEGQEVRVQIERGRYEPPNPPVPAVKAVYQILAFIPRYGVLPIESALNRATSKRRALQIFDRPARSVCITFKGVVLADEVSAHAGKLTIGHNARIISGERGPIEVTHEVLAAAATSNGTRVEIHYHNPLGCPIIGLDREQIRALPNAAHGVRWPEIGHMLPRLQIGGLVEHDLVIGCLHGNHDPVATVFASIVGVPKDLRIPEVRGVPIHHGIAGVLRPRLAIVQRVREGLGLLARERGVSTRVGAGVDCDEWSLAVFPETRRVVFVDDDGARENILYRSGAILSKPLPNGDRLLLPVHEVGGGSVPPGHVAPPVAVGIVLVEEVVGAVVVHHAIGIVHPVLRGRIVVPRAVELGSHCRIGSIRIIGKSRNRGAAQHERERCSCA